MNDTVIPLYSRISLKRDFPEYNLKRGDIATFVDTVPDPEGIEEGYILEVFNALGESIDVVTVPKSAVAPLQPDQIPSVRSLSQASSTLNSTPYKPLISARRGRIISLRKKKPKKGKNRKVNRSERP